MTIFLDVNIVMYAAGGSHAFQGPSQRLLERAARGELELISDVEILQEVLYRFWHIRRMPDGEQMVRHVITLIPLLPVHPNDALLAARLLSQQPSIEPRDAIHAAVMLNHGLTHLYSYDRHFDLIPGLTRLEPSEK